MSGELATRLAYFLEPSMAVRQVGSNRGWSEVKSFLQGEIVPQQTRFEFGTYDGTTVLHTLWFG